MKLIRDIQASNLDRRDCVATIGNFDGVHKGHQSVIRQLVRCAGRMGLPSAIITFEPLPMEYLSPKTAPARLTDFREKLELLRDLGVDRVVCLRFNRSLAGLSAQAFIEEILIQGLSIRSLIVGEDFRFGNNREGGIETLQAAADKYGFELVPAETYHYKGVRVSSSLVRGHLAVGDFEHVTELLGRSYHIGGKVIHGEKRGRDLGYPTANLACRRVNCPLAGVYVVRVHGLYDRGINGVANIGTRPVFGGDKQLLETYLLDFVGDIYGRRIQVEFLKKLRDEQEFHSVDALQEQMAKDVKKARAYFDKEG